MKVDIWKYITDRVGVVAGVLISLLIYSFIVAHYDNLVVRASPTKTIVVAAGSGFNLCRNVTYTRSTEFDLSIAFTQTKESGIENTINFPSVHVVREAGDKTVCRWVRVPSFVTEGEWDVRAYITTYTKPFWSDTKELAVVKMKVVK